MENPEPDTVAMCFSGGLDSTYSSLAHNDKKQLLMTIHGFSEESDYERWQVIKNQMTEFASEYGNKKNYFVRSNFRRITLGPKLATLYPTLTPWREYCQESLGLAGIAIPILATHNCNKFLIPSTFTGEFPYSWGSHPFIDNNIKFGDIRVRGHDYSASRRTKINFLKNLPEQGLKKPTLFICRHEENCHPCIICMKGSNTVNTILMENENPQDYGFKTNKHETMRASKELLSQEFPFPAFDKSEALGWEKIQKYAAELLEQGELDDSSKEYFTWLQTIDFHKFINNYGYFEETLDIKKYRYFLNNGWRQAFLKNIKKQKIK